MCFICNLYNVSWWSPGGWATAGSWVISIIVGLSAVLWALLVVLWESQLQERILWCGRSWFWDSVPRASQLLLLQPVSVVHVYIYIYIKVPTAKNTTYIQMVKPTVFTLFSHRRNVVNNLKNLERVCTVSGTDYPQHLLIILKVTFLYHNRPNIHTVSFTHPHLHPPSSVLLAGWQAVTHNPAVTVYRAGATLADGPWTL